jgi:methionyl-tRNA formyltransferase
MIKVLILTTDTDHHNFFLNNLKIEEKNLFVIYQKKKLKNKYKTSHKLLKKKEIYEKKIFNNSIFNRNINIKKFFDINSTNAINYINYIKPKIIIIFGTSILKKKNLKKIKTKILLNLHGGDPENYRGLDTLLWAIFHKDFKRLYTTLHKVNVKVDTGDIFNSKRIKINKKSSITNIGINNTNNCIKLVNNFIFKIINKKKIIYTKQKKLGRYYSALPSALIDVCENNLRNYAKKII